MKALVLAAGKGTRLGDLTEMRAKPMIDVGGQPLLAYTLTWLRGYGITAIAINLHHAPESITACFGDGAQLGVQITYSHEPELLGTAGAARCLRSFLDEPFVVIYGDVFTNLDLTRLVAFHRSSRERTRLASTVTLALYRVPNPSACGLVDIDSTGRVRRFVEKPPPEEVFTDLANAGIYVVEPGVLDLIPDGTVYDFGHDLFPLMMKTGAPIFALPVSDEEVVVDIGTLAGLATARHLVHG